MQIWRENNSLGDGPCNNPGFHRAVRRSTWGADEVAYDRMNFAGMQGGNRTKHPEGDEPSLRRFEQNAGAFTLVEVAISLTILVLVFHGILKAYTMACQRSEWSAHSLAAHSLAMQQVEAMRAAKWDPRDTGSAKWSPLSATC